MTSDKQGATATDWQVKLRDHILAERDKGNVVYWGIEMMAAPLEEFVKQPADGILYDLNRLEEVVMTFIHDKKWVNDFAVAMTIRKLVAQRDEAQIELAQAREGWQPIETAPKDGSAFLGYGVHDGSENSPRGAIAGDYWRAIILWDKWRDPNKWVFSKDGLPLWSAPSNWQPLPNPPDLKRSRGGAT